MIDAQPPTLFEQIRSFAEVLYFLAGIAIAVISWRALGQLDLVKKDIRLRNERAAKEQGIAACHRYLGRFVELSTIEYALRKANKIPDFPGPFDTFDTKQWSNETEQLAKRRYMTLKWLPALNELESIAAVF